MRFNNNLSITVDAYDGFTQAFDGIDSWVVTNTMNGALTVTRGAVKIGSLATFPNVPSVTVGENGVFSNESAQVLSLGSVTNLTVDGEFATSTIPFVNDGTVSLSIGANGSVTFPEDCTITLDTLTINGIIQAPRTYSKGSLAQVHGANLLVMNGTESATATWDGDGDVNEPSNWEGGNLPELTQYVTAPTFAAGGTHADINTDVQFNGIAFSAPAGTDGFELRGAGGGIQVGAGGISLDGTDLETARRYTISAPLDVIASQTWSVPSNQTLAIDNALTNINGIVTVEGSRGCIELKGTNTFAGAFISTATVFEVSGLVATPGHVSQGAAVVNGANTMTILGVYPLGSTTKSSGNLYVSNAVIEKPLYITYSGDGGIVSRAGTTNIFMGDIQWQVPGFNFVIGKNSELVFRGGFTTGWSFRPVGDDLTSVMRICDTPVTATASPGWTITRGKLSIEVPGNRIKILSTGGSADYASSYTNILLDLAVSYAFDDAQKIALMNGYYFNNAAVKMMPKEKGYAEIDLNGTTQRVATLCGTVISKFKGGESPAMIEVLKQCEIPGNTSTSDPFVNAADMHLASSIEGNVTIAMYGTENPLLLTNRVFESYGDIVVTNGTMEFAADASWPNGTNVTVSGNGLLKIGQADTFGKQAVLRFADTGSMYIPEGVTQNFAEVWDGDVLLKGGRSYNATTLPGRITGGGSIYIRQKRCMVIIR